jgi:hypothetical protein
MAVFARTSRKHCHVIFDNHVTMGRSTVNAAAFVTFLMFGRRSRQISALRQNPWQNSRSADVHDHKDGSIKILWQVLVKRAQSVDAAC